MDIDAAPVANEDDEDASCDDCGSGTYVLYDGDKVCRDCGYLAQPQDSPTTDDWSTWVEHRRSNDDYSGWYGENRIKMVGGFAAAYEFGEDFNVENETLLA